MPNSSRPGCAANGSATKKGGIKVPIPVMDGCGFLWAEAVNEKWHHLHKDKKVIYSLGSSPPFLWPSKAIQAKGGGQRQRPSLILLRPLKTEKKNEEIRIGRREQLCFGRRRRTTALEIKSTEISQNRLKPQNTLSEPAICVCLCPDAIASASAAGRGALILGNLLLYFESLSQRRQLFQLSVDLISLWTVSHLYFMKRVGRSEEARHTFLLISLAPTFISGVRQNVRESLKKPFPSPSGNTLQYF